MPMYDGAGGERAIEYPTLDTARAVGFVTAFFVYFVFYLFLYFELHRSKF